MPIYEYECPSCGHKFELRQGFDESAAKCPECNTLAKRLMSVASFSVGWRLKEECHERFGPRDEFERDV